MFFRPAPPQAPPEDPAQAIVEWLVTSRYAGFEVRGTLVLKVRTKMALPTHDSRPKVEGGAKLSGTRAEGGFVRSFGLRGLGLGLWMVSSLNHGLFSWGFIPLKIGGVGGGGWG